MKGIVYFKGINVGTGTHAIPPPSAKDMDALIRWEEAPETIEQLNAIKPTSLVAFEASFRARVQVSGIEIATRAMAILS